MNNYSIRTFTKRTIIIGATIVLCLTGLPPTAAASDPPPNDSFRSPAPIAALPFETSVDISGATQEFIDMFPYTSCPSSHTVWYRYTAADSKPIAIDTRGTPFLAVIAVFDDTSPVPSRVPVAPFCGSSVGFFTPKTGATYNIRVGSRFPTAEPLSLAVYEAMSIKGRVLDEAGNPPDWATVSLKYGYESYSGRSANTDKDGYYTLSHLPRGKFTLSFWASSTYLRSWYHNALDENLATYVEVADGTVKVEDQVVIRAGEIHGRVAPLNGGLQGGCIFAVDGDGRAYYDFPEYYSGEFTIGGLRAGTYYLRASETCKGPPYGRYETEWFDNASSQDAATGIPVNQGETVTGVHIEVNSTPVPANDARAEAIELSALPQNISQGVSWATREQSDPSECDIVDKTTWYSYTAKEDEHLLISSDAVRAAIGVFEERDDETLEVVGCSAGYTRGWGRGQADLELEKGKRYLIMAGATSTDGPSGISAHISDAGTRVTFNPTAPCHFRCPYMNLDPTEEEQPEKGCAPDPGGDPDSWQDHRVDVPESINGEAPKWLHFVMDPAVDHDVWFCRVEPDENGKYFVTYSANYAIETCGDLGLPVGCAERFTAPVEAGKSYIIRVYNYADPLPVDGTYWFVPALW